MDSGRVRFVAINMYSPGGVEKREERGGGRGRRGRRRKKEEEEEGRGGVERGVGGGGRGGGGGGGEGRGEGGGLGGRERCFCREGAHLFGFVAASSGQFVCVRQRLALSV